VYKKNAVKKMRYILIVMIVTLFMGIFSVNALAQISIDETKSIEIDMYNEISITDIEAGDVLSVDIQVTKGGPVDVMLMESSDYVDYLHAMDTEEGGTFSYYIDGSSDSIKSKKYSFTFPENGDYYLVIDNTINPIGGANPTGTVEVNVKINVTPISESPGFEVILTGIGMILALMLQRR